MQKGPLTLTFGEITKTFDTSKIYTHIIDLSKIHRYKTVKLHFIKQYC